MAKIGIDSGEDFFGRGITNDFCRAAFSYYNIKNVRKNGQKNNNILISIDGLESNCFIIICFL